MWRPEGGGVGGKGDAKQEEEFSCMVQEQNSEAQAWHGV